LAGQFSARHHDAVEAVSLYWHFVDVVWILLFSAPVPAAGKSPAGLSMHPLRHPRNAIIVGLMFSLIGVVYWFVQYQRGWHADIAGVHVAAPTRGRASASWPTS
jgi:hypothetical protein